MTYSINTIPLDNPYLGWSFRAPSEPLSKIIRNSQSMSVPGQDGLATLPSSVDAVVFSLMVQTSRANLEALYALFQAPVLSLTVTEFPWKQLTLEYLSCSPEGFGPADEIVDVTFVVRANSVYWRATTQMTSPALALSSASVDVSVFPGISAPISDALVRVRGAANGVRVTDSAGSWFSYADAIPSGSYLVFDCATGFATVVTSDMWSGGTDVTGKIDYSGGPTGLRITPRFGADPTSRTGLLTVATTARSGAAVEVRGRNAHVVV